SHVVEELPVDHHHRGEVAGRVALDPLDADLAVRGGLVVAEPRVLAQLVPDLVAAHDGAQGVDADADVVLADRLLLVLRVERHDARHLRGRDAELLRAELDAVLRDVPVLGLDEVQEREQRRPRPRIAADDLLGVALQPLPDLRVVRHRSTPPMTGSRLATAAMMSATMPPSDIAGMACRLTKDGSRKCARNGRVPPSLTGCAPSSPRGDSIGTYA